MFLGIFEIRLVKSLVIACERGCNQNHPCFNLVKEINTLVASHVFREANQVADALA